jgi:hypothetical protein
LEEVLMYGPDNAKPITAEEFKALCIKARALTDSRDECSLLCSLCRVMIEDLGDGDLVCPPALEGTTAVMDAILCDFLVYRYERANNFDPFPIIQTCLLAGADLE